jgi:hypothetical protein
MDEDDLKEQAVDCAREQGCTCLDFLASLS